MFATKTVFRNFFAALVVVLYSVFSVEAEDYPVEKVIGESGFLASGCPLLKIDRLVLGGAVLNAEAAGMPKDALKEGGAKFPEVKDAAVQMAVYLITERSKHNFTDRELTCYLGYKFYGPEGERLKGIFKDPPEAFLSSGRDAMAYAKRCKRIELDKNELGTIGTTVGFESTNAALEAVEKRFKQDGLKYIYERGQKACGAGLQHFGEEGDEMVGVLKLK